MAEDQLISAFSQLRLQSKLVLLDVNGLLCLKLKPPIPDNLKPQDLIYINKYLTILVRPGVREFIQELSTQYTIGLYSSTTRPNLEKIVTGIFGSNHLISFIADRSLTLPDPDYGHDPSIPAHQTIKNLTQIWNHPDFNPNQRWNSTNTLLIDHEPHKLRFNSANNCLLVPEFTIESYQSGDKSWHSIHESIARKFLDLP